MRSRQHGQILPLAVICLFIASLLYYYAVSSGHLVDEKIRITNAADAAAYSAATVEARALNFSAYANRAIIANQVALAQALSLASWTNYFADLWINLDHATERLADLIPPEESLDSKRKITVEVTDTGGFGVYVEDGRRFNEVGADLATLTDDIEFQISQAVAGADLVLFVIDAQAGVTVADERVAKLLRERVLGKRGVKGSKVRVATSTPSRASFAVGAPALMPVIVSWTRTHWLRGRSGSSMQLRVVEGDSAQSRVSEGATVTTNCLPLVLCHEASSSSEVGAPSR